MQESKRYPACIMATCPAPWNDKGALEELIFREQVRHLIGSGIGDLYIFGTAGEGYAVNEAQFDQVGRAFQEEMSATGLPAMIGIISSSLSTIIERIERAAAWGVHRFQLSLPFWGVLSGQELSIFFRETCGRFPDCQFLHYNVRRAGRLVTPHEYQWLAQEHSNLVAVKHAGIDSMGMVHHLYRAAPQLQHFFTEPTFAPASLVGECGRLCCMNSHGCDLRVFLSV